MFISIFFSLTGVKDEEMPLAGSEEKTHMKHSEDNPGLLTKIKKALFG